MWYDSLRPFLHYVPGYEFFDRGTPLYYLCCLSYLAIALYLYGERLNKDQGFLEFLFPARIYRSRSFRTDVLYYCINKVVYLYFFLYAVELYSVLTMRGTAWLKSSLAQAPADFSLWHVGIFILLSFLAADAAHYFMHRLAHRSRILWEFHKVHHSTTALSPFSMFRMHPVDAFLLASARIAATALVTMVFVALYGEKISHAEIFGMVIGVASLDYLFNLTSDHLHHSHLWWSWGRVGDRIFVSPAMHQIHHSRAHRHCNRNLGRVFSLWDGLFGTLYVPDKREEIAYGLSEEEDPLYDSVWALYARPFQRLGRLIKPEPKVARGLP